MKQFRSYILLLLVLLLLAPVLAACGEDKTNPNPTTPAGETNTTPGFPVNILPIQNLQPMDPKLLRSSFLRWSYYIPGDKGSLDSLKANLGTLDYVSPHYFNVEADGRISGQDETNTTALIKNQGAQVIPMLQNKPQGDDFHKIISDQGLTDSIIAKIDELTAKLGYQGIHIDFEGLNPSDRDNLSDFMRRLYARLNPKGKLVTMAVAPKQGDIGNNSVYAFDYGALAPSVDLVNVMAYDFNYPGGKPGPVAPVDWVGSVARYASGKFGARKVLLGIPFYGYEWNVTTGKFVSARTTEQVQELVGASRGNFFFNEEYKSPYAEYTDTDGNSRRIWFENDRSWAAKLELVDKLKLAGYAGWRLGQESQDFWDAATKLTPPTARKPFTSNGAYVSATGQVISPLFKDAWDKNGGAERFGQPLTGEIDEDLGGKSHKVQYFEKTRLEYYPEFKGTPNEIQVGSLGRVIAEKWMSQKAFQAVPAVEDNQSTRFLKETGHTLSLGFRRFWEENGGLSMYGFPISEEFTETSVFDGKTYTVQYFERARLEFDPATGKVRQGLLGTQYLWLTKNWLR